MELPIPFKVRAHILSLCRGGLLTCFDLLGGRIANMEAFLAFLEHVHSLLTTTYHNTPIMLMASPQWTRPDCEAIARYIFEQTRTPALCLIHSGVATQYGLKWPHMTVIDVGYQKVDVTCIYDSRVVSHKDVGASDALAIAEGEDISGGEVFTRKLLSLLEDKGFTYEMAEQLKKSNVCEVLPYVPDSPQLMELPEEAPGAVEPEKAAEAAPRIVEPSADDDGEAKVVDDEGVLNVAELVVSGQTREFLAKKEREKAAKAAKKGKEKEAADAAKAIRLPNSRKAKNVFHYEEVVQEEIPPEEAPAAKEATEPSAENGDVPKTGEEQPKEEANGEAPKPVDATPAPAEPPKPLLPTFRNKRIRRDIEVGLERFLFADRAEIDRIATAIYRAVQGIEDMYMRPSCWENLVFVGNGARIRGLRDNVIQTLTARHLVSPSTATMFTSELPSNLATPTGTGSQTPTGSFVGGPPHQLGPSSGVNPLLQAATTSNMGVPGGVIGGGATPGTPGGPGGNMGGDGAIGQHHFHSQTPTQIKLAQLPTYLSEWTKNGFEEAMFLGAQVAARLAYCIHNLDAQGLESQRLMSFSRVDFKYVFALSI
jgi:actin-related protein 9